MISQELLTALDDLIQAGVSASAYLHSKLSGHPLDNAVSSAEAALTNVRTANRTEEVMSQIVSAAKAAASQLIDVAHQTGDGGIESDLKAKLGRLPGLPWLTILGLGAGAIAIYFLWMNSRKKKALAAFEYPDPPEDNRPRLRGMSKTLGAFKKFGAPPTAKYEFEPELRLEGLRSRKRHTLSRRRKS